MPSDDGRHAPELLNRDASDLSSNQSTLPGPCRVVGPRFMDFAAITPQSLAEPVFRFNATVRVIKERDNTFLSLPVP